MPNIKAAEKWAEQSKKRETRNKSAKNRLKTLFKRAVDSTETAEARVAERAFDKAASKGLYDRLVTAGVAAFLADEIAAAGRYHLVVAADVFVYVNDLAPIVVEVARVLAADGLFAFTVETHPGSGVKLLPTLRYAHARAYVCDVLDAAGLARAHIAAASVRDEKGVPVDSLVVVAEPKRGNSVPVE